LLFGFVHCELESEYNQIEEGREIPVVEKFLKDSYGKKLSNNEIFEYTQRLVSFFKLLQEIDKNQSNISEESND